MLFSKKQRLMIKKVLKFYQNNRARIAFILVLFNLILLSVFHSPRIKTNFSELEDLSQKSFSFDELESFFKDVAERRGPAYAFDLLRVAPLPPDTDVHLLAHSVGNILYKKEGLKGIKICTEEFRNACSHSIVVGAFIEKGTEVISEIAKVCRAAPGGKGAYGMCFHGLGHGVLAAQNYDLRSAANLCRQVGTPEFGYTESAECVGGVIMEAIEGVHDRDAWEAQKATYFRDDDPLFPCNQGDWIISNSRDVCFSYLTPHLWQTAGADLGNPTGVDFEKAFTYCGRLSGDEEKHKEACYGGFGKEFVGLVKARDIRSVDELTVSQAETVYKWCLLAKDPGGVGACVRDALNSLYWGGENKPDGAITLCDVVKEDGLKMMCLNHLAEIFNYYSTDLVQLKLLCNKLPETFGEKCYAPKE